MGGGGWSKLSDIVLNIWAMLRLLSNPPFPVIPFLLILFTNKLLHNAHAEANVTCGKYLSMSLLKLKFDQLYCFKITSLLSDRTLID